MLGTELRKVLKDEYNNCKSYLKEFNAFLNKSYLNTKQKMYQISAFYNNFANTLLILSLLSLPLLYGDESFDLVDAEEFFISYE